MLTEQELAIVDYLEKSYTGARMVDDISCTIRISRALAAFRYDPHAAPEEMFTEKFLDWYAGFLTEG